MQKHYLNLDALSEFLQGNLNDSIKASKIGALVIAGNITGPVRNTKYFAKRSFRRLKLNKEISRTYKSALDLISDYLTTLAVNLPILLLPGQNDIGTG